VPILKNDGVHQWEGLSQLLRKMKNPCSKPPTSHTSYTTEKHRKHIQKKLLCSKFSEAGFLLISGEVPRHALIPKLPRRPMLGPITGPLMPNSKQQCVFIQPKRKVNSS
jgi:hypothetical protein